jgi:hypothetical protein
MKLINGVQRAEMSATFEIPPYAERARLAPGHFAHVGIEFDRTPEGCAGERFWVCVTANNRGKYVGTIGNALIETDKHGLKFGDRITFTADHVLDTWESDDWGDQ